MVRCGFSFNRTCGVNYDKQKLQSQLTILKRKYQIVKKLQDNSGFGWDVEKQIPTAPNIVWVDYLAAHPEASPFKKSPLEHFTLLGEIFTGVVSYGEYARGSNEPAVSVHDDSDAESRGSLRQQDENADARSRGVESPYAKRKRAFSIQKSPKKRKRSNTMAAAINYLAESQIQLQSTPRLTNVRKSG